VRPAASLVSASRVRAEQTSHGDLSPCPSIGKTRLWLFVFHLSVCLTLSTFHLSIGLSVYLSQWSVNAGCQQVTASDFDSLSAVALSNTVGAELGLALPASLVFDYPSIEAIASHVHAMLAPGHRPSMDLKLTCAASGNVAPVPRGHDGMEARHPSSLHLSIRRIDPMPLQSTLPHCMTQAPIYLDEAVSCCLAQAKSFGGNGFA
jgi:Phosphopantetheine attachment site